MRVPSLLSLACRCGHPREAHQHYRAGTDCALCRCLRFRVRLLPTGRAEGDDDSAH